jgi:hypothetical protein
LRARSRGDPSFSVLDLTTVLRRRGVGIGTEEQGEALCVMERLVGGRRYPADCGDDGVAINAIAFTGSDRSRGQASGCRRPAAIPAPLSLPPAIAFVALVDTIMYIHRGGTKATW